MVLRDARRNRVTRLDKLPIHKRILSALGAMFLMAVP
jgi:hypothetical protein